MKQQNKKKIWDVIVVGAGPAGCNAAIVLARVRRSVLIIDNSNPRNGRSQGMHNYLTRDGILPAEYLSIAHEELSRYGVQHVRAIAKEARRFGEHGFEILDSDNKTHLAKRLLLATGVTDTIPDIPGMRELWGKGVYHCPFCDGYELCDQNIGLYAKRFNGFGMAIALRELSASVILFTDGRGYLTPGQRTQLSGRGIRVVSQGIRELICSEDELTCVTLDNGDSVRCDAVFVHNGQKANNELLVQLGARMTQKGVAITNRKQASNIPGLYVAGDASVDIQFVVVAAAEGAKAGVAIHDDLLAVENQLERKQKPIPKKAAGR